MSYISIFTKIRFGSHPNRLRNSVINSERRLTSVLFVVLSVSLLTTLPFAIFECFEIFHPELVYSLPRVHYFIWKGPRTCLNLANSLFKPILIIYAIRMPEFRAGLAAKFVKTPNQLYAAFLPLQCF